MPTLFRLPTPSTLLILAALALGALQFGSDWFRLDAVQAGDVMADGADGEVQDDDGGEAMAAGVSLPAPVRLDAGGPAAASQGLTGRFAEPPATPPPIGA